MRLRQTFFVAINLGLIIGHPARSHGQQGQNQPNDQPGQSGQQGQPNQNQQPQANSLPMYNFVVPILSDQGTGLGLPIVRGLAEAHGGRVTLNSVPNQGTRITVILPKERVREAFRATG